MKPISLPTLKKYVDPEDIVVVLIKVIEIQNAALAVYSNGKNYEYDCEKGVNYI